MGTNTDPSPTSQGAFEHAKCWVLLLWLGDIYSLHDSFYYYACNEPMALLPLSCSYTALDPCPAPKMGIIHNIGFFWCVWLLSLCFQLSSDPVTHEKYWSLCTRDHRKKLALSYQLLLITCTYRYICSRLPWAPWFNLLFLWGFPYLQIHFPLTDCSGYIWRKELSTSVIYSHD